MKKASIALALLATSGVTAQELVLGADDKTLRQRVAFAGSPGSSTNADLASRVETLESQLNTIQSMLNSLQAADSEPPTIEIDAPTYASPEPIIYSVYFSDNLGLFQVSVNSHAGPEPATTLVSGEKNATEERDRFPRFGEDTVLIAWAIDVAGNPAMATKTIISDTGIKPGTYELTVPFNAQISGEGCQLEFNSPFSLEATEIRVSGKYNLYSSCDFTDPDENPEAEACIDVSLNSVSNNYSPLGAWVTAAIDSVYDTSFSKDSRNSQGFGQTESYATYTNMSVAFSSDIIPTIYVDMTLRCESSLYGTTEFGPYHLEGTLVQ